MATTIIEKVSLNFTDLTGDKTGCTTLGSNKFWTGWVEENGSSFAFECRWGPTGTPGSDKGSKRGISRDEAVKTLNTKVREKQAKGYTRLDTRTVGDEQAKAAAAGVVPEKPAGTVVKALARTFHPEVERLLGVIYNETSSAVRSGLSAQAGATAENPIGNLSDRQLDIGGSVLDDIQVMLDRHFGREDTSNRMTLLPSQKDGTPTSTVIDLTNRFMSNVPREIPREHRGLANLHKLVVASYDRLEAQRKFLQLLRDAHLTKDVFKAAASVTGGDKVGVWYDGLGCTIDWCPSDGADFRRVKEIFETGQSQRNTNWFRSGRSTLRLVRVWKFTRTGTEARFEAYSGRVATKPGATGRIMAWHGTRNENLLGIGKSGLLMPENLPRGVHVSGKAFGKGVYHAPAWNATGHKMVGGMPTDGTNGALKSMNYTSAQGAYYGSGNTGRGAFMFLQEVALGSADVRTSACWDKARPEGFPTNDFIFACGSRNQGGFTHDELVTFDQDAQLFRYLVEIEVV